MSKDKEQLLRQGEEILREGVWYGSNTDRVQDGAEWRVWHKLSEMGVSFLFREDCDDLIKLLQQVRERLPSEDD